MRREFTKKKSQKASPPGNIPARSLGVTRASFGGSGLYRSASANSSRRWGARCHLRDRHEGRLPRSAPRLSSGSQLGAGRPGGARRLVPPSPECWVSEEARVALPRGRIAFGAALPPFYSLCPNGMPPVTSRVGRGAARRGRMPRVLAPRFRPKSRPCRRVPESVAASAPGAPVGGGAGDKAPNGRAARCGRQFLASEGCTGKCTGQRACHLTLQAEASRFCL